MSISLTKPGEGTVGWASQVNDNFTALETRLNTFPVGYWVEEKENSYDAGTFTNGAWRTRAINQALNAPTWGSLDVDSNTITLSEDGDYLVEASAPAYNVNTHQVRLIVGGSDVSYGTSERAGGAGNVTTRSFLRAKVTRSGSNVAITLEHRCETTVATYGLGYATPGGWAPNQMEHYAEIKITKLT